MLLCRSNLVALTLSCRLLPQQPGEGARPRWSRAAAPFPCPSVSVVGFDAVRRPKYVLKHPARRERRLGRTWPSSRRERRRWTSTPARPWREFLHGDAIDLPRHTATAATDHHPPLPDLCERRSTTCSLGSRNGPASKLKPLARPPMCAYADLSSDGRSRCEALPELVDRLSARSSARSCSLFATSARRDDAGIGANALPIPDPSASWTRSAVTSAAHPDPSRLPSDRPASKRRPSAAVR